MSLTIREIERRRAELVTLAESQRSGIGANSTWLSARALVAVYLLNSTHPRGILKWAGHAARLAVRIQKIRKWLW